MLHITAWPFTPASLDGRRGLIAEKSTRYKCSIVCTISNSLKMQLSLSYWAPMLLRWPRPIARLSENKVWSRTLWARCYQHIAFVLLIRKNTVSSQWHNVKLSFQGCIFQDSEMSLLVTCALCCLTHSVVKLYFVYIKLFET